MRMKYLVDLEGHPADLTDLADPGDLVEHDGNQTYDPLQQKDIKQYQKSNISCQKQQTLQDGHDFRVT